MLECLELEAQLGFASRCNLFMVEVTANAYVERVCFM
jgi:hypothetical protein